MKRPPPEDARIKQWKVILDKTREFTSIDKIVWTLYIILNTSATIWLQLNECEYKVVVRVEIISVFNKAR